jgi:hypothetical protein
MVPIHKPAGFSSCKEGFFGREQILEDLKKRAETKGLTFIVGPPRRGKTRLMYELAQHLEDSDPYLYGYYKLTFVFDNPFDRCLERLSENYIRRASNVEKSKKFISSQFANIKNRAGVVLKVASKFDPSGVGLAIGAAATVADNMGKNQALQRLPNEILCETVQKIAEESQKKIVLILDQWEEGEDNQENRSILKSFFDEFENWPHVHIFINLRQNREAHNHCRDLAVEYANIIKIIEPPPLDLADSGEKERILNFLHEKVPFTKEIDKDSLIDAIRVTPLVIDRIQGESFDNSEALQETIKGAIEGTYIDIIKKIRNLDNPHRRALIFLSLLPELTSESWEELNNLGDDFTFSPERFDHLRNLGILSDVNPPQASHPTAWEIILKHLKAENTNATVDLGHRLAQTLASKIIKVTEDERVFITAMQQVINKLKPEGIKPWLEALETVASSMMGQNISGQLPTLCLGVEWTLKNNQALLLFIIHGLINLTVSSELDERRQCVEEILMLYELDADNVAIREQLTKSLYNLTVDSELSMRWHCVNKIRTLYELDADNVVIREHLSKGLYNLTAVAELDETRRYVQEILTLYELDADNVAIREQLTKSLCNLTAVSELDEQRQCVKKIRTLYEVDESNVVIREYLARGLYKLTVVVWELDETRQYVEDIRKLYELDADHVAIREKLATGLGKFWLMTHGEEKNKVLEELRDLRDRWPDDTVWKVDVWDSIFEE